jgi:hypothetical protein
MASSPYVAEIRTKKVYQIARSLQGPIVPSSNIADDIRPLHSSARRRAMMTVRDISTTTVSRVRTVEYASEIILLSLVRGESYLTL